MGLITAEGLEKLKSELAWREGEHDEEIREALKEARSHGDLSENAEFDSAKDEQAENAARIRELHHVIENAVVVQDTGTDEVSVNNEVVVEAPNGKQLTFTIVGPQETNSLEGKISNESPAGAALCGKSVGEVATFTTPSGREVSYKVISIALAKKDLLEGDASGEDA